MLKYPSQLSCASIVILFGAMLISPAVNAQCGCPSDRNGSPAPPPPPSPMGLGQAFPEALDLAADPNWQVYEFERDGIRYVQVNDQMGIVRAAVGRIGDTFWVLPLGRDADRVTLPGNAVPRGQGKLLYRNNEVEIIQNRNGGQDHWIVRAPVIGQNRKAVRAQRAGQ